MKKQKSIDSIEVKSPCSEDWSEMKGNSRVRFCSHCENHVNNISELTRKEASRLVRKYDGRLCVRYYKDPQSDRPLFLDSLYRITRRTPAMTAGVMATSFAVATAAYSQGEPVSIPQVSSAIVLKANGEPSTISGYVTDPNGAAVSYALVSLINEKSGEYRAVNASFEGFYEFKDVTPGDYSLKFEGGGFDARELKALSVGSGGDLRRDVQLALPAVAEVVEVGGNQVVQTEVMGIFVCVEARNPLVQAVMNEDVDEVKARVLMRSKVNVKDKAYSGISPLHAAVETGNMEIIQFLLDHGAKTNIRDFERRTPLMMIDGDASAELFDLLIRYGAKPRLVDKESNNVLHHFVENADNAEIIRLLISHGIDVNATNKGGDTALMKAAENENREDVKALLESGADANKINREGKSAIDLTRRGEIKSLLETYGAVARNP